MYVLCVFWVCVFTFFLSMLLDGCCLLFCKRRTGVNRACSFVCFKNESLSYYTSSSSLNEQVRESESCSAASQAEGKRLGGGAMKDRKNGCCVSISSRKEMCFKR